MSSLSLTDLNCKDKITELKDDLRRQRQGSSQSRGELIYRGREISLNGLVNQSYGRESVSTYQPNASPAYSPQRPVNPIPAYPGPHAMYDQAYASGQPAYDRPSRTNTSQYAGSMRPPLSRYDSRDDTYPRYSDSNRAATETMYGSSPRTQPIPIPSQRRPSTFSDASENSFDSMYGFQRSVSSQNPYAGAKWQSHFG